ncbi:MAG TPA: TonB family protein, partial [Vicinamibacterales bacterium]|nr:TonB family protein [Vicinamibacterales bacterium]
SLLVHVGIVGALIIGPLRWVSHTLDEKRPVMTISLGGAGTGPQTSGLTTVGARAVQTTEPATKPEAVRAPAAAVPKMTVPIDKTPPPAKPAKTPPKALEDVAKTPDARGTTLSRGDDVRTGAAVADTGARGQGFGLTTGGGTGVGATIDVGNFCCPDYISLMNSRIMGNWNQQTEVSGAVIMKVTIQRDGRLTDIGLEQSSGYTALDINARRALEVTRQLTSLPSEYPNPTLTVHLTFKYQR